MGAQNPAPYVAVPGNLAGSLAGAAASVAVGFLVHAGYLATAAAFMGCPEAAVSGLAMALVGAAVNYGITHVTAIKSLNDLYAMIPTTYAEYPGDSPKPAGTTNLVDSAGNPVKVD